MPEELFDEYGDPIIRVARPKGELYDEYGDPIPLEKATQLYLGKMPAPIPESLKQEYPKLVKPSLGQKTVKTLGDWTPILAGEAASLLPVPPAIKWPLVGVATGLGTAASRTAEMLSPDSFGSQKPPDFQDIGKEAVLQGLLNAVLTPGMRAISHAPFGTGEVRKGIAETITPDIKGLVTREPEVFEWLKRNPDFEPTVGQLGTSPVPKLVQSIATPIKMRQIVEKQQEYFKNEWDTLIQKFGLGTPEQLADNVKRAGTAGLNRIRGEIDKAYTQLFRVGDFNKTRHYFDEVTGPVYLDNAANPVSDILKAIKADPELKLIADADKPLAGLLQQIGELKYIDGTIKPISIEQAIKLKSLLGKGGKFGNLMVGGKEVAYRDLDRLVDTDIKRSIAGIPGNPQRAGWNAKKTALEAYTKGNALTEQKYALFGRDDVPEIYKLLEDPTHTIANVHAIKDPDVLDRLMAGASFNDPAKKEIVRKSIASNYLQNLLQDSFDKVAGKFNKDKPIQWFTDRENSDMLRRLFTSRERSDIEYLFKTIQHFDPNLPLAGVTAAGIRGLGALATFVPGTIMGLGTGSLSRGTITSGAILGTLIGANIFSRAVLLNPKVARAAANLMRLPAKSMEAKVATGVLYSALKGAQVELISPDGKRYGTGTVTPWGKVKPNFQFGEQSNQPVKEAVTYP